MTPFRIGVTGDIFRFSVIEDRIDNFQHKNVSWLFELLANNGLAASSFSVEKILTPEDKGAFQRLFSNDDVFNSYIHEPAAAWARLYDVEPDALNRIFERLLDVDIVLGFELPPGMRRKLHRHGKIYINLYVHPVRFLRDLCFGATTNSPGVFAALNAIALDTGEIAREVSRYKALFMRQNFAACRLPDDFPLLIGQTASDSVLIRHADFAQWDDYAEQLSRDLKGYDTVGLLEHPSRANSASIVEFLRGVLGKSVVTLRGNSYGLIFSNPQLPRVITLASSLGVEAQAAGHPVDFLLSDPREKFVIPEFEFATRQALSHGILDSGFWEALAAGGGYEPAGERGGFYFGDNYLRNSLDGWSFALLQRPPFVEHSRRIVIPAATVNDEDLTVIAQRQCGGYDPSAAQLNPVTQAADNGIELLVLEKPLAAGERRTYPITTAASGYYLSEGFHGPEPWGIWSRSLIARACVAIDNEALPAELSVSLELTVYNGIAGRAPVVEIMADDETVGFVFFGHDNMETQTASFDFVARSQLLNIGFRQSDTGVPRNIEGSSDTRSLGFGLRRLDVTCNFVKSDRKPLRDDFKIWGGWSAEALPGQAN